MNDQKYKDLKVCLSTGRIPTGYTAKSLRNFKYRSSREYSCKDRNLWKNGLKVLPKGRAKFIVADVHRISGHPKAVVLQQLVSEQYSVVGLEALCRKVAKDCPSCKDNLYFFRTTGEMRHLSLDRRSQLCSLLQLESLFPFLCSFLSQYSTLFYLLSIRVTSFSFSAPSLDTSR